MARFIKLTIMLTLKAFWELIILINMQIILLCNRFSINAVAVTVNYDIAVIIVFLIKLALI